MAAIVLITIAYTAATVFQCTPFRKIYGIDPDEPPIKGTCVDRKALFYSGAGINFISDVVILGIPVPMLWGLGFPKKQRIALVALFSMGGVACIASIARMVVIDQVIDTKDPTCTYIYIYIPFTQFCLQLPQLTLTGEIHKHSITSCLEISLGIICASISSLKPFLARYTPHLFAGNARFLNQGSLTINSFGSGGAVQDNRPMSWYTEQRLAAAAAHGYRTIPDEESGVGASAGDVDVVGGPSISQDNTHSRHEPGQVLLRPEDDRPTTASTLNTTTSYASTLLPPTTPPSSLPFFPRNLTRKKKRLIPHKLTTSPNPIPTLPPSHHSSSSSGAMASRSPMKRIGEWGRDKIQTMMLTCSTPNTPVSDVQHSRARGRDSDSAILVLVPKGSTLGEEHEGLVLKMYVDDPVDSMEEEGEWLWEGERDREREMEPELEMERGKARGKSDKREDGPSKQRLWSATGAVRRKPVGGGTETLLPQHTHQESSLTSPSPSSSQESPMPRQPKFDTSPPPPPPAASKVPTAVPPSPLQFNVGATLNGPALDDYYYYY